MEILSLIWQQYLYLPLFNFLVWLYLNHSWYNLGVAVVILTIILRIALLPFTILSERGKLISLKLRQEIKQIKKDFASDPVQQKLMVRQLLKKKKIRPWAKAVVLGVQGLVLVLLYRVFMGGINTEAKLHLLYPGIPRPDFINTKFLWFDISERNLIMPAIVAGYLFGHIAINFWERRGETSKKEQIYSLLFPASVFLILAILPSVKSIFILTSLIFSSIISIITGLIRISINKAKQKT
ncbi:MAG: YidC/Oxa1 family membrane protein insertase [Patescibacteria group bacterium]|jgi:YidC/Oxa1 family membrane protein insertase